ncbi:MAG: ATP-binding protein, partial [Alphaproteobacteria bacterium]|nr:ATP-binding protein [Alphaproteobacteria bacterium]
YSGILLDVTELKGHESALVDARDAANPANRAKTEFLANMSHELRTPLNAIIGFAEIINMETFGPLESPEYREYIGDIRSSGHHLLEVINDILDLSKIETGEMSLSDGDMDMPKIVASSLRLMDERAAKGTVRLVNSGFEGLPNICADVRMLKQILLNILSNAVKFIEPGGLVSISGEIDARGRLYILVADTGIGMSPGDLTRAFAPFQQVDHALRRRFEGTGLGLPLVKSMMELHGGKIELQSERGAGTPATPMFPAERVLTGNAGTPVHRDAAQ